MLSWSRANADGMWPRTKFGMKTTSHSRPFAECAVVIVIGVSPSTASPAFFSALLSSVNVAR
ncbi:hypothetical protein D3C87_2204930 [compost metagenome]